MRINRKQIENKYKINLIVAFLNFLNTIVTENFKILINYGKHVETDG